MIRYAKPQRSSTRARSINRSGIIQRRRRYRCPANYPATIWDRIPATETTRDGTDVLPPASSPCRNHARAGCKNSASLDLFAEAKAQKLTERMWDPIRARSVAAPRACRARPAWSPGHSLPDKSRDALPGTCEARPAPRRGSIDPHRRYFIRGRDQDRGKPDTSAARAAAA